MKLQEQVLKILFENDKTKSWLAGKLGMSKSDLGYQLNDAVHYPAELHTRILEIFRKEGFLISGNDQCTHLIAQTLQIDSIIANSITMLNGAVQKCTADNDLSFEEKKQLHDLIDDIAMKTADALDRAKAIVAGKSKE